MSARRVPGPGGSLDSPLWSKVQFMNELKACRGPTGAPRGFRRRGAGARLCTVVPHQQRYCSPSPLSCRGSLPACPLCTEGLGTYGGAARLVEGVWNRIVHSDRAERLASGRVEATASWSSFPPLFVAAAGPTTLPCGHNLCVHCCAYLAQRQAACPLCRAPFPSDARLAVNCELRELLRLAQALTAVDAEGEDGWQAVTSAARGKAGSCPASPRHHPGVRSVGVGDVLDGSGSVMELDPQPWEPDSSSAVCRCVGLSGPRRAARRDQCLLAACAIAPPGHALGSQSSKAARQRWPRVCGPAFIVCTCVYMPAPAAIPQGPRLRQALQLPPPPAPPLPLLRAAVLRGLRSR